MNKPPIRQSPSPAFKVPFSGKSRNYTPDEIQTVVSVMQNADPHTQGIHQATFQQSFSKMLGIPHAFAVSSATAALELAAILCRLTSEDRVIIPAHTFAATAIPFARTGAKIDWADIDPETWTIDPQSIKKLITPKTKAIVIVHLYGLMADMQPILGLANEHNLYVIEDCAQSLGATYQGQPAGSFGDFACFSFHTHKNITTLGEGGMLTVKDPELASKTAGLRHNGIRPYPPREFYWKPAMSLVDFDFDGFWPYNFCLGEAQCALGTQLLTKIDSINSFRGNRFRIFQEAFKNYPELSFQKIPADRKSSHHLMPARFAAPNALVTRDDFIQNMAYQYGIQIVVQYHPLFRYPMFQKAGFGKADCPHTDDFFDHMVSFPFHEWLPEDDFQYMIRCTRETLDKLRKKKS